MLYDHQCSECGSEKEVFNRMNERHTNAPVCCGERMPIIIKKAPYGFVDRPIHYRCPVTNEGVTSKQQRRNIMAREGLVSAHELQKSKEQRNADVQQVADLKEQAYGPQAVQDQVNSWAKKQVAQPPSP